MGNLRSSTVVLCAVIIGGAFVLGKYVEKQTVPKTPKEKDPLVVTVTSEEQVSAVPDTAEVSFGVTTGRQSDPAKAMGILSTKMNAAYSAVQTFGLKEGDVGTRSLNLSPSYDQDKEGNRTLKGFEASQTLHVRVSGDLKKTLGSVLQAAVQAGATDIADIHFTVAKSDDLLATAKEKATRKAQQEAASLAQRIGKRLGAIKGYAESANRPREGHSRMRVLSDAAVPLPAGSQTLSVSVSLTYELID